MTEPNLGRLGTIVAVAIAAHVATLLVRALSVRILRSRFSSESKVMTITGFASSTIVFAIYFGTFGFLLSELGVSLTTYLASASVIGLAVSFGSQGVVQDVINGLTVVFSDLIDVGDMVDLSGQVGIVEKVGMRFTVLVNFSGARVFVPNRSILNVINYPNGYIRAHLDARLPSGVAGSDTDCEARLARLARSAYEQYPGVLLLAPSVEGRSTTEAGYTYIRIKFRIWPGQGALLENFVKPAVVASLRELEPGYPDWMVTIHYRSEPLGAEPAKRLPRPSVLKGR